MKGNSRNLIQNHLLSQQCLKSRERNRVYRVVESYLVEHLNPSVFYELKSTSSDSAASQSVIYSTCVDQIEGRFLLCGDHQGILTIYDLEQSSRETSSAPSSSSSIKKIITPVRTIPNQSKSIISSVQWFPRDTGLFFATSITGKMTLYDTNASTALLEFPQQSQAIYWCQFSPHESRMTTALAAAENGTVRVCDVLSGDCVHTFRCHQMATTMLDWNPIRDYEFVTASKDGTVKTWDIRRVGNIPILSLDWSKDHSYHLTQQFAAKLPSYHSMAMRVDTSNDIQAKKAELRTNIQLARAHESEVMSVRYSPCGNYLLSSGNDTKLRLWSSATGGLIAKDYSVGKRTTLPYRIEFVNFPYLSTTSAPSNTSSGDYLFLFPHQQKVSLLPLVRGSGNPLFNLTGHFGQVMTSVYRPFRQQIITSSKDGLLLLWDQSQFQQQREEEIDNKRKKNTSYHLPLQLNISATSSSSSTTQERIVNDSAEYYSNQIVSTRRSSFLLPIIKQYLLDADMVTPSAAPQTSLTRNQNSSSRVPVNSEAVGTFDGLLSRPKISKADLDWSKIDSLLDDDEEQEEQHESSSNIERSKTFPTTSNRSSSHSNSNSNHESLGRNSSSREESGEKEDTKFTKEKEKKNKNVRSSIDKILGKRSRTLK
eukprot:gene5355-5742_t